MSARLLKPALLLVCLCGPTLVAAEPVNEPSKLQLELLLVGTEGELAIGKAELQTVQAILGRAGSDSGDREVLELRGRVAQLEQRLANLSARKDLITRHLDAVSKSGKQFRDLLKVGLWATVTEIQRGADGTGEYRVRLFTVEEKEEAAKEVEGYRERAKVHALTQKELLQRIKQRAEGQAELLREYEEQSEKFKKEGSEPSKDLQGGFYELVEVGTDYVGFRRDGGKVVTYHRLSSIQTIEIGLE